MKKITFIIISDELGYSGDMKMYKPEELSRDCFMKKIIEKSSRFGSFHEVE